jgi:hypothetical protein
MNFVVEDRLSKTDFSGPFVMFSNSPEVENSAKRSTSRLTRDQIDAFLNAKSDNARSGHFFVPPPEQPAATPEKDLALGVLRQAARDLRRFRSATRGVRRELYLDAYTWITANDFSWPYSFVNVCKLLGVCPEVVRTEIVADASLSWFDYWTKWAAQVSQRFQSSFVRVFAGHNSEGTEAGQMASTI